MTLRHLMKCRLAGPQPEDVACRTRTADGGCSVVGTARCLMIQKEYETLFGARSRTSKTDPRAASSREREMTTEVRSKLLPYAPCKAMKHTDELGQSPLQQELRQRAVVVILAVA